MVEIRTLFADPGAVRVDGEHGTWLLSGVETNQLRDLVTGADGVREVRGELAARAEDATVVFVSRTGSNGRVSAFRSATSSRDLFYLRASDGAVVLTDHFRNAVSQLDVADRDVPHAALVDHLLFRSPIEPTTYVDAVSRLGRGEWLQWESGSPQWTRSVVDALGVRNRHTPEAAVDALDDALAATVRTGVRPDARTMLSGGVDSALLASYRDDPPPAVQVAVDAPEFRSEVEAGRRGADLLDVARDVVPLEESSFRRYLESTVDVLGAPPRYNQTVFTAAGFGALDPGQYVNGQGADALFGLPGVKAARLAAWLAPMGPPGAADRAAALAPGSVAAGCRALATRVRQLQRPPTHPRSLAQQLAADADPAAVADVFDAGDVRDRAQRRYEYAAARSDLDGDASFAGQVAAGHLVDFLCDDAVNQWRQVGYATGQDVVAPFRARRVARTALRVPRAQRYVEGLRGLPSPTPKHVPKRLLSRRVPDYPVGQEKGAGALPIERFVTDGPLADVFDRYDPPVFLTPAAHDRHVASYGSLTWELLTYSVWRDRILLNDALDPVPGTEHRSFRVPGEPPTPVA